MCIVIVSFPEDEVVSFEINFCFVIKKRNEKNF